MRPVRAKVHCRRLRDIYVARQRFYRNTTFAFERFQVCATTMEALRWQAFEDAYVL